MSLIILFGLPGAGKTFTGKVFAKYFDYYFYDGDKDLTEEMKEAIKVQKVFTETMRDVFFKKLTKSILNLKSKHKKLAVAQTFIKENYRVDLINKIPEIKFIFIRTKKSIIEKRLCLRKNYPLDLKYTRKMVLNFDKPITDHLTIINNEDGEKSLKKQIKLFFDRGEIVL